MGLHPLDIGVRHFVLILAPPPSPKEKNRFNHVGSQLSICWAETPLVFLPVWVGLAASVLHLGLTLRPLLELSPDFLSRSLPQSISEFFSLPSQSPKGSQ